MVRLQQRASLCVLVMLITWSAPVAARDHPGWSTEALLDRAAELLGLGQAVLEPLDQLPQGLLIDPTEDPGCFIGEGDELRVFDAGGFSSVIIIGDEARTQTLLFYYPVVSVTSTDAANAFYRGMFGFLLPGWEGTGEWAKQSLRDSWLATGRAMLDPIISIDQTIARHSEGDVRLATFWVPPDLIFYRVTSRSECEKVSPLLLASPREIPKDEARRDSSGFRSTPPHEGRRRRGWRRGSWCRFDPRPRMRGDRETAEPDEFLGVSIHAPA